MNVEERKQQARNYEQQGELASALELYEEILSELEGTQAIWRELPLYVKAGDLSLKMGDATAAIAQYEKAARAYAAYGSSKSVIALCTKILRVNPGHTHAFLRLVRLMIERHHLADARLVLMEYADRMKLPKAHSVLEGLVGRTDEELKPLLELLLELGGRYEYARAQGRDHLTEAETAQEGARSNTGVEAAEPVENAVPSIEDSASLRAREQYEPEFSRQDEVEGVDQGLVDRDRKEARESDEQPELENALEQGSEEVTEPTAAVPGTEDVQWVEARPSMRVSGARHSRKVLFRESEARNKPNGLWIGLGIAAVVVVGGLSLVLFNVIPLGGGNGADGRAPQLAPQPAVSDSALLAGVELDDSAGNESDSSATMSGETGTSDTTETTTPGRIRTEPEVGDSSGTAEAESDSEPSDAAAANDSTAAGRPGALLDQPPAPASPELPPSRGVMVQDFDVESNSEFNADGRVGFRITQILGTGERLTLNAIYYGEDVASAPGSEAVTLAPLAGDTTTAMVHFNGYAVEARAIVSASVLQALLGRLVEVPRSN